MTTTNPSRSYHEHVANLKRHLESDAAVRTAIGGEFLAIGLLEYQLLKSLGLGDDHSVIDVGCGSGRLAFQLKRHERLRYLGIDVVPDLLEHAARITGRPDWKFTVTEGTSIPAANADADFVCFFSVFTHLLHEQSYRYLKEAYRVLKPGGCVVLSFLEFRIPCHWDQFQHSQGHPNAKQHLNQFLDRDAIAAWAQHLGFAVELIADGDRPHIPLEEDVQFENGQKMMTGMGNLGQSVAVLRKPKEGTGRLEAQHRQDPAVAVLLQDEGPVGLGPHWNPTGAPGGRFICASARGRVGLGDSVLIVGFVVSGGDERILIRAISSVLIQRGITDVLARPHISVLDRSGELIAENIGWATLPNDLQSEISSVIKRIGAAQLDAPGNDAALLLRLAPGEYTAMIHGGTGMVLAEVCEVPELD